MSEDAAIILEAAKHLLEIDDGLDDMYRTFEEDKYEQLREAINRAETQA